MMSREEVGVSAYFTTTTTTTDEYMQNIKKKWGNGVLILYVPYLNCSEISNVCNISLGESNLIL